MARLLALTGNDLFGVSPQRETIVAAKTLALNLKDHGSTHFRGTTIMTRTLPETVFLLSVALIIYTWALYPLILVFVTKFWSRPNKGGDVTAKVSVLVKCYNEAGQLAERIENLLALEYPRDRLEIWIGSDGSTDDTYEIACSYESQGVSAVRYPRLGPARVHNNLMGRVKGDIVLFTDAGTRFPPDLLRRALQPFADPRVGCVAAEIDFINRHESTIGHHRGLYWKVEHYMRRAESKLGILAIGNGACMAVRRTLLRPLAKPSYDVDFITPMDVVGQGQRVVTEPGITVTDYLLPTARGEFRAGVRMVAKNFGGTLEHLRVINPLRYPGAWFSLFSHKIFRWLTPFFLLALLAGNALLLNRLFFRVTLAAQLCFYFIAIAGAHARHRLPRSALGRALMVPFSFCLANLGFLCGVVKGILGKEITFFQNIK
jgi:poly-beta-1,6-N-acetyl-D-glucosamine synthase